MSMRSKNEVQIRPTGGFTATAYSDSRRYPVSVRETSLRDPWSRTLFHRLPLSLDRSPSDSATEKASGGCYPTCPEICHFLFRFQALTVRSGGSSASKPKGRCLLTWLGSRSRH